MTVSEFLYIFLVIDHLQCVRIRVKYVCNFKSLNV